MKRTASSDQFTLAALCGLVIGVAMLLANIAMAQDGAPPEVDLRDFGRFDVQKTAFAEDQQSAYGADEVASQIENILRAKVEEWSAQPKWRGQRTLSIQPYIVRIRLNAGSPLPRSPLIILRLKLTDRTTGTVLAEPEFSGHANGLAATFTRGRTDSEMLTRVAREASAFLESSYQATLAAITRERTEALAKQRAAAEQGDVVAQVTLGTRYSAGQDVERDDQQAAMWWRKAAEQGDATAQFHLAAAYAAGQGVPQDDKAAVSWLRKAADQGNPSALRQLGAMYEAGRGVARDKKESLAWYRRAAAAGDVASLRYIARVSRDSASFRSFDEAQAALEPEAGVDVQLVLDPMSVKGRILVLRMEVLQVLSRGELLMSSPYGAQVGTRIFYGYLPETYLGSRDFVDNQTLAVIGEVVGTYQYTTTSGGLKTVPKIRVYGIRSGP